MSLDKVFELAVAANDLAGQAEARASIGRLYRDKQEPGASLRNYQAALDLYVLAGRGGSQEANVVRGNISEQQTYVAELEKGLGGARQLLREAQELFLDRNPVLPVSDRERALDLLSQALELYEAAEDLNGQSEVHSVFGTVYMDAGDNETALTHLNLSLGLSQTLGDTNRVNLVSRLVQQAESNQYYGVETGRTAWSTNGNVAYWDVIAEAGAQLSSGNFSDALGIYLFLLTQYQGENDVLGMAQMQFYAGLVNVLQGEFEASLNRIGVSLGLLESIGAVEYQIQVVLGIGEILAGQGDLQGARLMFTEGIRLYEKRGGEEPPVVADLRLLVEQIDEALGG